MDEAGKQEVLRYTKIEAWGRRENCYEAQRLPILCVHLKHQRLEYMIPEEENFSTRVLLY